RRVSDSTPPPHHTHTHMRAHTHTHPQHPPSYPHPPTHPDTHTHVLTHTDAHTHICKHTHAHARKHAHTHTHTHTHSILVRYVWAFQKSATQRPVCELHISVVSACVRETSCPCGAAVKSFLS